MKNLAIFVSGSGTNCENIIRYFQKSEDVRTVLVVSNRDDAYALVRAMNLNVPAVVLKKDRFNDENVLLPLLREYNVDYVILAGFLLMAPSFLIREYDHKIINIHPALLPKYGGKGFYGEHVHEAVVAAKETYSGITIHYVNELYDSGEIIFQAKIALNDHETPDTVAAKIHVLEQANFPVIIEQVLKAQ